MPKSFKNILDEAEAVVIGAGAGLSTAAGFEYGKAEFMKHFRYMFEEYGYRDMYSAGFHHFDTEEEKWGYWSKFVYLNRYATGAMPLYKELLKIIKNKNYFVITTNVDHQFQKAGFDKTRLFYTQGDYGLFQCSKPCCNKTYDNEQAIREMVDKQRNHKVPSYLLPVCPYCGKRMEMNLRSDDTFVEDDGWVQAKERYIKFLKENKDKKILFLELGVGYNTPVIIKYPFWNMTYQYKKAFYVCINRGYNEIPEEIRGKALVFDEDIAQALYRLK